MICRLCRDTSFALQGFCKLVGIDPPQTFHHLCVPTPKRRTDSGIMVCLWAIREEEGLSWKRRMPQQLQKSAHTRSPNTCLKFIRLCICMCECVKRTQACWLVCTWVGDINMWWFVPQTAESSELKDSCWPPETDSCLQPLIYCHTDTWEYLLNTYKWQHW